MDDEGDTHEFDAVGIDLRRIAYDVTNPERGEISEIEVDNRGR